MCQKSKVSSYVASNVLVLHSANSTEQIKCQEDNSSTGSRSEPGTPKIQDRVIFMLNKQDRIVTTLADFFDKAVWVGYNT
jgi:16S rRNA U516 pseudouridylate synthase RsuA-like enzyme